MGCIMKSLFTDPNHARDVGIVLTFPGGEQRRLFIRMGFIVQDGDAHKRVHWCKGDAGMKLCMICRNLHSIKSAVVGEDGSNLLTCGFVNEADIEFATGAEIRGSVRRLAEWKGFESNPLFKAREQAYGFTHSPHNLLLDPSLDNVYDPADNYMHDWMHGMIVHGVFNVIAYLLLEAFWPTDHGIWNRVHEYVACWHWPSRFSATGLADVFSAKRSKASRKADFLKCSASEALCIYGLLAFFVQPCLLPSGEHTVECRAFLATCDVRGEL